MSLAAPPLRSSAAGTARCACVLLRSCRPALVRLFVASANSRHGRRTAQAVHTTLAWATCGRECPVATDRNEPVAETGNKRSGSASRHAAARRQPAALPSAERSSAGRPAAPSVPSLEDLSASRPGSVRHRGQVHGPELARRVGAVPSPGPTTLGRYFPLLGWYSAFGHQPGQLDPRPDAQLGEHMAQV
jgi:hypothetical protein